jgi:putative transposase
MRGPFTYYVLFFIHLHTRKVHLAGMTPNPDGTWMAQVAGNMSMVFAEEPEEFRPTHIVRDRDAKYSEHFCSLLETDGIEFRPIPPRSPNMNPFSEVWVQRTKQEVLDHFLVFGESHLRHILACWLTYYHQFRPHQGIGNVPISGDLPPSEPLDGFQLDDVVCHESLGGLLKHYERRAA